MSFAVTFSSVRCRCGWFMVPVDESMNYRCENPKCSEVLQEYSFRIVATPVPATPAAQVPGVKAGGV